MSEHAGQWREGESASPRRVRTLNGDITVVMGALLSHPTPHTHEPGVLGRQGWARRPHPSADQKLLR